MYNILIILYVTPHAIVFCTYNIMLFMLTQNCVTYMLHSTKMCCEQTDVGGGGGWERPGGKYSIAIGKQSRELSSPLPLALLAWQL
jgi:hypothetical protein